MGNGINRWGLFGILLGIVALAVFIILFFNVSEKKQFVDQDRPSYIISFETSKSEISSLDCPDYEKLPSDFRTAYNWECFLYQVTFNEDRNNFGSCNCFAISKK